MLFCEVQSKRRRAGRFCGVALGVASACASLCFPCGARLAEAATETPVALCSELAFFCEEPWWKYWQEQESRAFVSFDARAGAFAQVRSIIGYGKPFWTFSGLEVFAGSTSEFAAWSIGPRWDLLAVNASFDFRRTHAYTRERPLVAERYFELEKVRNSAHPNRYSSLDGWLWGYVPLGRTLTYWEVGGVYLLDAPRARAIFEEYYRFTMNDRSALSLRMLIWLNFLKSSVNVGPSVDAVLSPGRDALMRVGGSLVVRFTEHTKFQLALTVPTVSPDDLDFITQSWGSLSLGYSFATGEPRVSF